MQLLIKRFKHFRLNNSFKHLVYFACLSALLIPFLNCGKRKPPLPPTERVAQRVAIDGFQIGNQIRIVWQMPARNASGGNVLNIQRADIYRLAEPTDSPLGLTEEQFASRSTLIATVEIKDGDFALREKTFTDQLQISGQEVRLRYAIRFVNSSGQKAAFSNFFLIEPTSRVADRPAELQINLNQDRILVSWKAPETNVDGSQPVNIAGYNLYRRTEKTQPKKLNDTVITDTNFSDSFFTFEEDYQYFVRTVSNGSDGRPVESLASETILISPKDTFAPAPPDSITIAAAPTIISIFFAVNLEKDVVGYKVFRTTNLKTPPDKWELLTPDLLKENTFQDKRVVPDTLYYYYLIAVDKFGNESQPSVIVSETAP